MVTIYFVVFCYFYSCVDWLCLLVLLGWWKLNCAYSFVCFVIVLRLHVTFFNFGCLDLRVSCFGLFDSYLICACCTCLFVLCGCVVCTFWFVCFDFALIGFVG